jgi:thiosulfate/3-mercaptopyruvate sulfurtransferase
LVSTAGLAGRLGDSDINVVSAPRGQAGRGRSGDQVDYIPGAVVFDIGDPLQQTVDRPHRLPSPAAFAERMGRLGLRRDATVVVYDVRGVYSAPPVWWALRLMGFPRVLILDGGLNAWRAEGRPIAAAPEVSVMTALSPALEPALACDLESLRYLVETEAAQIVDARPAARFGGEAFAPHVRLRSGHGPDAVNVPFHHVLTDAGRLKSAVALQEVFSAAGVDLARPIVTASGSGRGACILALALARLGRHDVAVCDGRPCEWHI